jgi:hypothetical protein
VLLAFIADPTPLLIPLTNQCHISDSSLLTAYLGGG